MRGKGGNRSIHNRTPGITPAYAGKSTFEEGVELEI